VGMDGMGWNRIGWGGIVRAESRELENWMDR